MSTDNTKGQQEVDSRHLNDVFVKIGDRLMPIRELSKNDYEQFLDFMHHLRLAYIAAVNPHIKGID